jgi:hypothetical protein
MTLAINTLQKNQLLSGCSAAGIFIVPNLTLNIYIYSVLLRLGSRSKFRLLIEIKEEVLIS